LLLVCPTSHSSLKSTRFPWLMLKWSWTAQSKHTY